MFRFLVVSSRSLHVYIVKVRGYRVLEAVNQCDSLKNGRLQVFLTSCGSEVVTYQGTM